MRILFIGAGRMGLPIISSWKKGSGHKSIDIHLVEKLEANINKIKKENIKVNFYKKIPKKWKGDVIFFAVKPQDFKKVAEEINLNNVLFKNIVSIMAGITTSKIRSYLKTQTSVTRVMPNLAVEVNLGVNCIFHSSNSKNLFKKNINSLFGILGNNYEIKDEKLLESVTAISGSGPAYFFLFLNVFEKIAHDLGFSKKVARGLTYGTVEGALELVKMENNTRKLIESVSSKKGTTEAALKILEKKNTGLYKIMKDAVYAAKKRANSLSKLN